VGTTHQQRVNDIWATKEILRDHYKRHQYGDVILPLTVLRRLESVLEPTRAAVVAEAKGYGDSDKASDFLAHTAGKTFYNTTSITFSNLLADENVIEEQWYAMLSGYSPNAREMIARFGIERQIETMAEAGILFATTKQFAEQDLSPTTVTNVEMGYVYEELVRLTADLSNEEAGEHFTPREVIELMVNIVFAAEDDLLGGSAKIVRIYDGACGTGGMLTAAQDHIEAKNPKARVHLFGQELQPESFATARADMMLEDRSATIEFGDTLLQPVYNDDGQRTTGDAFTDEQFDYMLMNPPYGKDWKTIATQIKGEAKNDGFDGRFGAGLPTTSDGQILFVQHMISKMKSPEDGGSRIAVVLNGSPMFIGGAGSGMSEIRRWIIETDLLDCVIGLPDQMFYNTDISTYIWVLDNAKPAHRRGSVQLIDARKAFVKMQKSLGKKRNELSPENIARITGVYESHVQTNESKIVANEKFGTIEITVEQPLRQRFVLDPDTIADQVADVTAIQKLNDTEALLDALPVIDTADDDTAREAVKGCLEAVGLKGKPLEDAILKSIAQRDDEAEPSVDSKGRPIADTSLRDTETIPLPSISVDWTRDVAARFETPPYKDAIEAHMKNEVLEWVPDGWVDWSRCKIGYDLPFTRLFYTYTPPRPLEEIRADLNTSQERILQLLGEVGA